MERIAPKSPARAALGPDAEGGAVEDDPAPSNLSGDPLYVELRAMRAAWAKEAG